MQRLLALYCFCFVLLMACKDKHAQGMQIKIGDKTQTVYKDSAGYFCSDRAGKKPLPQELDINDRANLVASIYSHSTCKVDTINKIIYLNIPKQSIDTANYVNYDTLNYVTKATKIMRFVWLYVAKADTTYNVSNCFSFLDSAITDYKEFPNKYTDSARLFADILPQQGFGLSYGRYKGDTTALIAIKGNIDLLTVRQVCTLTDRYAQVFNNFAPEYPNIEFRYNSGTSGGYLCFFYEKHFSLFRNLKYTMNSEL